MLHRSFSIRRVCVFSILWIALSGSSSADEIVIDTETGLGQVGGLFGIIEPADPMDPPMFFSPDNTDGFQNYFMGRSTIGGVTFAERRAFFMFDTAGLAASIPLGHDITGVTISLENIFGGVMANFSGTPPTEFVAFTSTDATPAEILDASLADPEGMLGIFDTFGVGTEYGGFEFKPATADDPTIPGKYPIALPGAIPDLTDAIALAEVFVITARLETFDPDPIATDPFEFVFGLSDAVKTVETSPGVFERVADAEIVPFLTISTAAVPEPSGLLMIAGLSMVAMLRRQRS